MSTKKERIWVQVLMIENKGTKQLIVQHKISAESALYHSLYDMNCHWHDVVYF